MNVRDRVSVTDTHAIHYGVVTTKRENGLCSVKWDSGITELIHESELTVVQGGAPEYPPFENNEELPRVGDAAVTWRDRLVALWERLR